MSKNKSIWRGIALSFLGFISVVSLTIGGLFFIDKDEHLPSSTIIRDEMGIFEARSDLDNSAPSIEEVQDHQVAPDEPRYMTIDKIGVDRARVVGVGVSGSNNRLGDPANIHDVGWYTASIKPGGTVTEERSAGLYDGHNTGMYARGVFDKLGDLQLQDEIIVERGDGKNLVYRVQEINTVPIDDVDMKRMLESAISGVEGLNLISCAGSWDADRDTYSHRVLVRATLVEN